MLGLWYLALLSALFTSCLAVDKPTCKKSDYGGAVAGLLETLPGLQQQQQINQLASAVEGAIADCMFVHSVVKNFELESQEQYICASYGYVVNQGSFKRNNGQKDIYFRNTHEGAVEITVPFAFTQKVGITLNNFAVSMKSNPSGPDMKGTLSVSFGKSWFNLIFHTGKSEELSKKVTNSECILKVKEFGATFTQPEIEIKAANGVVDATLEEKIKTFVLNNIRIVEDFLRVKLKTYTCQALMMSGKWVCPQVRTKDFVSDNIDAMFKKPSSSKFNIVCPGLKST